MAHAKAKHLGRRAPRRAAAAGVVSTTARKGGGARWRIAGNVAPSFDAVALVDHISDVVLAEHWHAIGEGRKVDGSGPQPELAPYGRAGRRAAEGLRPDVRGFTGLSRKPFRDNLERTAIKISGGRLRRSRMVGGRARAGALVVNETVEATKAKTSIQPDRTHAGWLSIEAQKRSIQYLSADGYVAHLVDLALASWLDVALDGALAKGDKRERKANKAKAK